MGEVVPLQPELQVAFRGFADRLGQIEGTDPASAMLKYVAQTVENGKIDDAGLGMATFFREQYHLVPKEMRPELEVLAGRLHDITHHPDPSPPPSPQRVPRNKKKRRKRKSKPVEPSRKRRVPEQFAAGPSSPLPSTALVALAPHRQTALAERPPAPQPATDDGSGLVIAVGLLAGLGLAHWSDKG